MNMPNWKIDWEKQFRAWKNDERFSLDSDDIRLTPELQVTLLKEIEQLRQENNRLHQEVLRLALRPFIGAFKKETELKKEIERLRKRSEWLLHNAGLLNDWTKEWYPWKTKLTLIAFLEERIQKELGNG